MKKLLLLFLTTGVVMISCQCLWAQSIETNNNLDIDQIVQDSLITGCLTASNVQVNSSGAFGYFSYDGSNFPFDSGLILCSGDIDNAEGPNNSSGAGSNLSGGGDSDLQQLLPSYSINDATVIEFDFVPASDTVRFNYIFGSEEFPEYVNSSFNDVFGFFISGPGISGPYSNNAENIALLPNGDPVTIDDVYGTQWYTSSSYGGAVEYDGCTLELTAEAIVQACETYHIKLAVGDAGDHILDSGVFIEAGSFTSGTQVTAVNHSNVGDESDLYEGCTNYFVLCRQETSDINDDVSVQITYMGESTAEEGVDVTEFPTELVIPAGQECDTVWYSAFNDGIEDGDEIVILGFGTSCPCGNDQFSVQDTVVVFDAEGIKGGIQDVQTNYCGEEPPPTLDLVATVNIEPAFYLWDTGSEESTITINTEPGATSYYLTITDECGNEVYDSITIRVSSMDYTGYELSPVSCHNSCDGGFTLNVVNDFQPFTYIYGNADFFYIQDSLTSTFNPEITGLCPQDYYVKIVDDIGCYITTEITVPNKPNIEYSAGITTQGVETAYCDDPPQVSLQASANQDNVEFEWFNNTSQDNVSFTPIQGTHCYWVRISDMCGNYMEDDVYISVSNLGASAAANPSHTYDCDGELWVNANGGIMPYTFYWEAPLNEFGATLEEVCPGNYSVEVTDSIGCTANSSAYVGELVGLDGEQTDDIQVYPNPTSGQFYIALNQADYVKAEMRLFDVSGKMILTEEITDTPYLSPKLSAGTYFAEIWLDDSIAKRDKIIVTE